LEQLQCAIVHQFMHPTEVEEKATRDQAGQTALPDDRGSALSSQDQSPASPEPGRPNDSLLHTFDYLSTLSPLTASKLKQRKPPSRTLHPPFVPSALFHPPQRAVLSPKAIQNLRINIPAMQLPGRQGDHSPHSSPGMK
jgi:hypothetical protein